MISFVLWNETGQKFLEACISACQRFISKNSLGVPIVAQQKQTHSIHEDVGLLTGLTQQPKDPVWLWLWRRSEAAAPI